MPERRRYMHEAGISCTELRSSAKRKEAAEDEALGLTGLALLAMNSSSMANMGGTPMILRPCAIARAPNLWRRASKLCLRPGPGIPGAGNLSLSLLCRPGQIWRRRLARLRVKTRRKKEQAFERWMMERPRSCQLPRASQSRFVSRPLQLRKKLSVTIRDHTPCRGWPCVTETWRPSRQDFVPRVTALCFEKRSRHRSWRRLAPKAMHKILWKPALNPDSKLGEALLRLHRGSQQRFWTRLFLHSKLDNWRVQT